MHVQEPLGTFAESLVELHVSHEQAEAIHADSRKEARKVLQQMLDKFFAADECCNNELEDLVAGISVIDGQPADKILAEVATLNADLIVMGSHHHNVLGETLLGSTTNKVLHRSEIPVLVVRIPDSDSL